MSIRKIWLTGALLFAASVACAERSYDIAEFYTITKPASGAKAIGKYDKVVEAQYILIPTRPTTGKFIIEVERIADNIYKDRKSDLCIETRYCYQRPGYSEKIVLIIESNYGYSKGKLIFD